MFRFRSAIAGTLFALLLPAALAHGQEAAGEPVEEAPAVIKVFTLRHADAEEMQRVTEELFGGSGAPQGGDGRSGAARVRLRASVDPRTNSLIVVGLQQNLKVIEALLLQLDQPPPAENERQDQALLEDEAAPPAGRASRAGRSSEHGDSSHAAAPPSPPAKTKANKGAQIRIEAHSPNGTPLKVVSVVHAGNRVKKGDLLLEIDSAEIEKSHLLAENEGRTVAGPHASKGKPL